MTEENYSKRELDMCFEQIHEKLDAIHEQTKATNGRVTALERWKYGVAGGIAVLTMLVLPLVIKVLSDLI